MFDIFIYIYIYIFSVALGGKDDYEWSLGSDSILDLYATESRFIIPDPLLTTVSTRTSRSSSLSSIFFDAQPHFDDYHIPTSVYNSPSEYGTPTSGYTTPYNNGYNSNSGFNTPSVYGTPGSLTPIHSHQRRQVVSLRSEPRYFLSGFHMGDTFLTSFFRQTSSSTSSTNNPSMITIDSDDLTKRLNQLIMMEDAMLPHFPHMLPDTHPQSMYVTSPVKMKLVRAEQKMTRYTRKLFHLSFAYKGAIYWLLLYCVLRGPVEHTLKKTLAKIFTSQQQITYSTMGATATIVAALSASIQNNILNKP